MSNERAHAEMADALDGFESRMRVIAEIHRKRAALTASASVRANRVRITVNADSQVIETRFADDIDDLDYDEIAAAVTDAAQRAAAEIARKTAELMATLETDQARIPKLAELIDDLPDVTSRIPGPIAASTVPPGKRSGVESEQRFVDVEDLDDPRGNVRAPDW